MHRKRLSYVAVLLSIVCMIVIFKLSSHNSINTNSLSINFTSKLANIVFSEFNTLSKDIQNIMIGQLNLLVRKIAHFLLYFILGFFSFASVHIITQKYKKSLYMGITVCSIYAILDELHQIFVPGRTPLLKDVIIDVLGGICGMLFYFLIISALINIRTRIHKSM